MYSFQDEAVLRQDIENLNLGGLQIREGNQYIHTWSDRIKLSYGVIGNTSGFGPEESRFEPLWDNTVYLIPGSRVKTIGEFGMSREWWCKLRETYNGGVPKTKETMRMGDHALVRISTTWPGFDVRGNVLVCKGFESLPGYAKNTERSFLALGWVLEVQIFISNSTYHASGLW